MAIHLVQHQQTGLKALLVHNIKHQPNGLTAHNMQHQPNGLTVYYLYKKMQHLPTGLTVTLTHNMFNQK